MFNAALAVEGQHIVDHAPHPRLYFDYLDSDMANALAFTDGSYSFIGVTLPLVGNVSRVSAALSASDAVISSLDLPRETDREPVHAALFWMMLNFVVTHEYSHHVRGHIRRAEPNPVEEIRGGSLNGGLQRQAREADADGYSAYFSLAYWFDSPDGRQLVVQLLQSEHLPSRCRTKSCSVASLRRSLDSHFFGRRNRWRTTPPIGGRIRRNRFDSSCCRASS